MTPEHQWDQGGQFCSCGQDVEIPCGYNGGRPCDYTGRGGKGYCEGCCRCPW